MSNVNIKIPVSVFSSLPGGKSRSLFSQLPETFHKNGLVFFSECAVTDNDAHISRRLTGDIALLKSGVLCFKREKCIRESLSELFDLRESGEIPPFDHILIETGEPADSVQMCQDLTSDQQTSERYYLNGLVCLIQANINMNEVENQRSITNLILLADIIVLAANDSVCGTTIAKLRTKLKSINCHARQILLSKVYGPEDLYIAKEASSTLRRQILIRSGLQGHKTTQVLEQEAPSFFTRKSTDIPAGELGGSPADRVRDTQDEESNNLTIYPESIPNADQFLKILINLASNRDSGILNIRGIFRIENLPQSIQIQRIRNIIEPFEILENWPGKDKRNKLIFIGSKLNYSMISKAMINFTDAL